MRFYFILFFDSLPFWFSLKSQDSGLVGPVPLFGLYTCIERNWCKNRLIHSLGI